MTFVVKVLDGHVFDSAVHPLDLTVGPGMVHLCQPMLDAVLIANAVEDMITIIDVACASLELETVSVRTV